MSLAAKHDAESPIRPLASILVCTSHLIQSPRALNEGQRTHPTPSGFRHYSAADNAQIGWFRRGLAANDEPGRSDSGDRCANTGKNKSALGERRRQSVHSEFDKLRFIESHR